VCGIWLGIGDGANVVTSKSQSWIAGYCVNVTGMFYCELRCIVIV